LFISTNIFAFALAQHFTFILFLLYKNACYKNGWYQNCSIFDVISFLKMITTTKQKNDEKTTAAQESAEGGTKAK